METSIQNINFETTTNLEAIVAQLDALVEQEPVDFSAQPLFIKIRILYDSINSAFKSRSFWTQRLEEAELEHADTKFIESQIGECNTQLDTMLPVLKAMSHATDGGLSGTVKFDTRSVDEHGAPIGDINYEDNVATAGKPHAWATTKITEKHGVDFDTIVGTLDEVFIAPDLNNIYDMALAQYTAQLILVQAGLMKPSTSRFALERDAINIILAVNSSNTRTLKVARSTRSQWLAIRHMLGIYSKFPFTARSYVNSKLIEQKYTLDDLIAVCKNLDLEDADILEKMEDQKLDNEARESARELRKTINAAARDAVYGVSATLARAESALVQKFGTNSAAQIIAKLSSLTAETSATH
jgi:hypothetical protein